jgi:hypothetical protein
MKHNRFIKWLKKHKKPLLIVAAVSLAVLAVLWFMGIFSSDRVERTDSSTSLQAPPEPATKASPLTGVEVEPELAARPVTAVIIENSPDARPQSGLKEAGLVFEAIAEGGITRFISLYQEARPELIGPVRSVRPYYNDLTMTFDAAVAHVGGSAEGMAEIQQFGIKDLDQFYNAETFWRATDRYAPHNVYTNFDNLDAASQAKDYTTSEFDPIPRKEATPIAVPTAKQISIPISSYLYQVDYTYDPATNKYTRFMGGEPHVDREKGTITPDVAVAMKVPNSISGGFRYDYELVGSGEVQVFQDGGATEGTWSRADRSAQFVFKDSTGKIIELNPGQTWITVTSPGNEVTWTP